MSEWMKAVVAIVVVLLAVWLFYAIRLSQELTF